MAKVPLAGTVKTRLHSMLSPEDCAALARAFLDDTIKKAETICKNIFLAYSPAGQSNLLEDLISPEISLIEQTGANLGEKMANAFEFAFRENAAVVMIGTDSPTFPAARLAEAFEALEKDSEIVLGKSTDGGFYLIGLRELLPKLFDRIEWSTPRVFEQITRNIKNSGIEKLKLLPEHYDVDTPPDFLMMKDEILGDEALQKLAAKTYRWLSANFRIKQ
jgi:rSAM/selenodomain-associated transferase 1